jgi:hypothetical protein
MHSKSPSQGLACLQHFSNSLPHGSQRGGNLSLPSTSSPASHGAPSAQQTLSFPHSPWILHSQVRPPLTSHTKSSWNPLLYFENAAGFQSWLQKASEAWKLILRSSEHTIVMADVCNSPITVACHACAHMVPLTVTSVATGQQQRPLKRCRSHCCPVGYRFHVVESNSV